MFNQLSWQLANLCSVLFTWKIAVKWCLCDDESESVLSLLHLYAVKCDTVVSLIVVGHVALLRNFP